MGRSSGSRAARWTSSGALKEELQRELEGGQCVYCRARASSNEPLTREHVIPRARGGRRKDFRIIVAACARCNRKRGSRELVPFLLERPRRISSFLDYLATRSPESVREVDPRIFAELYVAVAIVGECTRHGTEWRQARERLCAGRSLHRRRYAVRRAVREVSARMDGLRERGPVSSGPSCILPARPPDVLPLPLEEPLERLASRLLSLLALAWGVPGETAAHELKRSLERISAANATEPEASPAAGADAEEMLRLDRWAPRQRRPRARVDRRSGDRRRRRYNPVPRGRAA